MAAVQQKPMYWLYAGVALAGGIGLLVWTMGLDGACNKVKGWPTTTGTMLAFNGQSKTGKYGDKSVSGNFTYEYDVNGHHFQSSQFSPAGRFTGGSEKEMDEILNADPDGKMTVWYNPDDPSVAYMSTDHRFGLVKWVIALVLILGGAGGVAWMAYGTFGPGQPTRAAVAGDRDAPAPKTRSAPKPAK